MPNWGRFFKPSEYGNKDIDFKADKSSEGIDIDKKPDGELSKKTPKQRVDDYKKRHGATDYITADQMAGITNEQSKRWVRGELEQDVIADGDSKYAEHVKKFEGEGSMKSAKDFRWGRSYNNPMSRQDNSARVIDNKRNRIPPKKGGSAVSPRDVDGAQKAGEAYNRPYDEVDIAGDDYKIV